MNRVALLLRYEDMVISDKGSTRRKLARFTTDQSYDRKFAWTTK